MVAAFALAACALTLFPFSSSTPLIPTAPEVSRPDASASPDAANTSSVFPRASAISPGFPYGSQKIRGVNLGGWLVIEPWITPSIFDNTGDNRVVDEFTFGQFVDRNSAASTLQNHWNTWITEADFAAIAAAGLNHVRLPIGYWAFDVSAGEPYHQGQVPFLNQAVTWARNHGLKVIVDLHGAPGSQNGFDNSGQKMSFPQWQANSNNVARTSAVIKTLANMFKNQADVVTAIAPLNEPAGFDSGVLPVVKQYWLDSYGNIRFPFGTSQQSNTIELIHDAFQPLSSWNGWEATPNFQGVMMDTHIYQMFSNDQVAQSQSAHIASACGQASRLTSFTTLWTVVGEWTTASTDCAKYLNGRGVGARYDGTFSGSPFVGSCTGLTGNRNTFSASYKTFMRQYYEAQINSYEKAQGWIFWTWKAENADDWTYQAGLAGGWIPQDPTNRQFPNICP
ncbi:glycoside hydrolase family 5 protein [Gautieria morchelliformis]|nr:glycoside hydrolase family 5 protein [Gautieria morchelliformis]